MAQVARISTLLYQNSYPEDSKLETVRALMLIFAAYLHDVADHKYETPESIVLDFLAAEWPKVISTV